MKWLPAELGLLVLFAYGSCAAAAERIEPPLVNASSDCSASDVATLHRLAKKTIGLSYSRARRQFFKAGWKPAPVDELGRWLNGREDLGEMSGTNAAYYDKGFVEIDGCAVDRDVPCTFRFQNASNDRLRVDTSTEHNEFVGILSLNCSKTGRPAE